MGRMTRLGVDMPLRMYIDQDARDARRYVPQIVQAGLGLPDRDYYLDADDAKFKDARASYLAYLTRLLELSRAPGDAAASARGGARPRDGARAGPVDARRARAIRSRPTTGSSSPPWRRSRPASTGRRGSTPPASPARPATSIVQQPSYLGDRRRAAVGDAAAGLEGLPAHPPAGSYAPFLGQGLRRRPLRLRRHDAVGHDREPAALEARRRASSTASVGRSARQALRRRATSRRQTKARMEELVANLLAAYRESIDALDWMSPATKKEAQAKLATFAPKIGYPKQLARLHDARDRDGRPGRQRRCARASSSTRATSPSSASRSIATSGA